MAGGVKDTKRTFERRIILDVCCPITITDQLHEIREVLNIERQQRNEDPESNSDMQGLYVMNVLFFHLRRDDLSSTFVVLSYAAILINVEVTLGVPLFAKRQYIFLLGRHTSGRVPTIPWLQPFRICFVVNRDSHAFNKMSCSRRRSKAEFESTSLSGYAWPSSVVVPKYKS
ncbi:hypothetical protein BDZ97DRAFT_1759503 [Flammula alnicola]|nr:hypothetical protein BDZ97DRAFT_1759503 [Flammula alnicola]